MPAMLYSNDESDKVYHLEEPAHTGQSKCGVEVPDQWPVIEMAKPHIELPNMNPCPECFTDPDPNQVDIFG